MKTLAVRMERHNAAVDVRALGRSRTRLPRCSIRAGGPPDHGVASHHDACGMWPVVKVAPRSGARAVALTLAAHAKFWRAETLCQSPGYIPRRAQAAERRPGIPDDSSE